MEHYRRSPSPSGYGYGPSALEGGGLQYPLFRRGGAQGTAAAARYRRGSTLGQDLTPELLTPSDEPESLEMAQDEAPQDDRAPAVGMLESPFMSTKAVGESNEQQTGTLSPGSEMETTAATEPSSAGRTRTRSASNSGWRAAPYTMGGRSSPSPKSKRLSAHAFVADARSPPLPEGAASLMPLATPMVTAQPLRRRSPQGLERLDDAEGSGSGNNNGSSSDGSAGTPPHGAAQSGRNLGLRRGIAKRGGAINLRDKSILRIAATLQDETHPFAGEVASEARLSRERRLASSSNDHPFSSGGKLLGFVIPPSARSRHRSPFVGNGTPGSGTPGKAAGKKAWEEQDDQPDLLDDVAFGVDSGELSSDEEQGPTMPQSFGAGGEDDMEIEPSVPPDANAAPIPRGRRKSESKWTNFREARHPSVSSGSMMAYRDSRMSASPSAERSLMWSKTPAFGPSSFGGSDIMESANEELPPAVVPAPWQFAGNNGGRMPKRKAMEDRYEPYAASAHKRRAVSPMHQLSLAIPQAIVAPSGTVPITSPSSGPFHLPVGTTTTPAAGCYFTSAHAHQPGHSRNTSRVSLTGSKPGSRASSPALTNASTLGSSAATQIRPSTPTTMLPPVSSPSIGTSIPSVPPAHSLAGTPKMATTPGAGSGPGYGSGALGLSLGLNHSLYSSPSAGSGPGGMPRGLGVGPVWPRRDRGDEVMQEDEVEEGLSMIEL